MFYNLNTHLQASLTQPRQLTYLPFVRWKLCLELDLHHMCPMPSYTWRLFYNRHGIPPTYRTSPAMPVKVILVERYYLLAVTACQRIHRERLS